MLKLQYEQFGSLVDVAIPVVSSLPNDGRKSVMQAAKEDVSHCIQSKPGARKRKKNSVARRRSTGEQGKRRKRS